MLDDWPFGAFMCSLVPFTQSVSVFVSSFTMTAIAVDRYQVISTPLHTRAEFRWANRRAVFRSRDLSWPIRDGYWKLVLIWSLSLLLSVPWAVYHSVKPTFTCTTHHRCQVCQAWVLSPKQVPPKVRWKIVTKRLGFIFHFSSCSPQPVGPGCLWWCSWCSSWRRLGSPWLPTSWSPIISGARDTLGPPPSSSSSGRDSKGISELKCEHFGLLVVSKIRGKWWFQKAKCEVFMSKVKSGVLEAVQRSPYYPWAQETGQQKEDNQDARPGCYPLWSFLASSKSLSSQIGVGMNNPFST